MAFLSLPTKYNDIRPHHYIVLYGTCYIVGNIITSTNIITTITKKSQDYGSDIFNVYSTKLYNLLSEVMEQCIPLVYTGYIPDFIIRWGIRIQLRSHLKELSLGGNVEQQLINKQLIVSELYDMPIAIDTKLANEQHYEVPTKFYDLCLGPRKKYSSGYWKDGTSTNSKTNLLMNFEQSEIGMLEIYCKRCNIYDGMKIVDLGCGWGSFTLYVIEKYPNCIITSISNSQSQREYIYKTAALRQLNIQNINIITVRLYYIVCFVFLFNKRVYSFCFKVRLLFYCSFFSQYLLTCIYLSLYYLLLSLFYV